MPRLYLPIASQPRELDARLLLGLCAAERGWEAFIGFKGAFRGEVGTLGPGYFLAHNARQNPRNFDILTDFGNRVIVLDEEALVRQSDEIFLKKHRKGAFDRVARVMCWGADDRHMWERQHPLPCPVDAVGNPRIDLLRPEACAMFRADADALTARFGDFVLLNTNFPSVNNITAQGQGVRLAAWAMDDRGRQIEQAFLDNKTATFAAMQALIEPLARAIAPVKLIIRPHPNEVHEPWVRAAAAAPNAHVVFEGGVIPWLMAALALVHNNCTTAIESAVAGTPVLNFRPWRSDDYDNPMVHDFGRDCPDADTLAATIREVHAHGGHGLDDAARDRLRHHIESVDGALSVDRIMDILERDARDMPSPPRAGWTRRAGHHWRTRRLWATRMAALHLTPQGRRKRDHLRTHFPQQDIRELDFSVLSNSLSQLDLHMRQFPPLDEAAIRDRIAILSQATGRFGGVRATRRRDGIVELS